MKRVIVAANRLPVSITVDEVGVHFHPSPGGLASALSSLKKSNELVWLGWPGEVDPETIAPDSLRAQLLEQYNAVPIFLSRKQLKRYYFGFSNRVLWPVLHYLPVYIRYDERDYEAYREVNQLFADQVVALLKQGGPDDVVWIHDYQLMLAPAMIRQQVPEVKIGFFLHTPFPSSEMFRTLPYREELLRGILGASLVGFHTFGYLRHFRSSLLHVLGLESEINRIVLDTHQVRIGTFPISIDVERTKEAATLPADDEDVQVVRNITRGRRLILCVDRMDYTKGIPERLRAYKKFLERNPELATQVVLVQVAVPSRTKIYAYQQLREEVEQSVSDIEETFENFEAPPIHFIYRSLPFKRLMAFYREAEVALVTPYFDGMNLVAKEYVAVKQTSGVLILSEHAGAAAELGEALIINPWNPDQISDALRTALEMPEEERTRRMTAMYEKIVRNDVHYWSSSFLRLLEEQPLHPPEHATTVPVRGAAREEILERFTKAKRRVLLFDYDGTLAEITNIPMNARPTAQLQETLRILCEKPGTDVYIVTGRPRHEIEGWLGHLPLGFSAEHGLYIRDKGDTQWQRTLAADTSLSWYEFVKHIFHEYNMSTPGSFTEEKEASIAWHYRLADPRFGRRQARELIAQMGDVLANQPLEVLQGKMVVEVRVQGINKATILKHFARNGWEFDFMLGIGDDVTDESLFAAMPKGSVSIKVGSGPTRAAYRLKLVRDVANLLSEMAGAPNTN